MKVKAALLGLVWSGLWLGKAESAEWVVHAHSLWTLRIASCVTEQQTTLSFLSLTAKSNMETVAFDVSVYSLQVGGTPTGMHPHSHACLPDQRKRTVCHLPPWAQRSFHSLFPESYSRLKLQ